MKSEYLVIFCSYDIMTHTIANKFLPSLDMLPSIQQRRYNCSSPQRIGLSYREFYLNSNGIRKTMGYNPIFMRSLPKKVLINNWSSWKIVDEINMERARYLLSTDEMVEEMLGQPRGRLLTHGYI
jgi:hypothetical protein